MFIIGELINGMYLRVGAAILEKNAGFIQSLALRQVEAGAQALDVNCGPASRDAVSDMRWLVETVQKSVCVPLCLDSTKADAVEEGLKSAQAKTIINSTSADIPKLELYVSLAKKYNASLIALLMDKRGVPQDKDRRLELAAQILNFAQEAGLSFSELYLDPVVLPVGAAQNQLFDILEVIRDCKILSAPAAKTVVGLSNVSQGTKNRSLINRTFLAMAQCYGLDAAILDPLDRDLMDSLVSAEVILNKAVYCDSYLEAYGKGRT